MWPSVGTTITTLSYAVEYISKTSVLDLTDEITVYKAERIVKGAEVSISKASHVGNDGKESKTESLRMNSVAREFGIPCEEAANESVKNVEFSVADFLFLLEKV